MGGTYDHSEDKFKQLKIPFVLTTITTTKEVDPAVFSSVIIDDLQESYKAVSYLISLGHRNICFLARFPLVQNTTGNKRLMGYIKALEEHGIEYDPSMVEDCEYSPSSGFTATKRLLNKKKISLLFLLHQIRLPLGRLRRYCPWAYQFQMMFRLSDSTGLKWQNIIIHLWIRSANPEWIWRRPVLKFCLT